MKDTENKKKSENADSGEKAKEIFGNAWNITKKVASNVQQEAKNLSEKAKENSYERRMKKYNPIFPKEYKSKDFTLPKLIIITDDTERKNIDVCEGAIGWSENLDGIEVLYLYEEAIKLKNITFIPYPAYGNSYYVDNFDKTKYIKTDSIFSKSHEEKLAELERIAYELGAKSYSIEIVEKNIESNKSSKNMEANTSVGFKKFSGSSSNSYSESATQSTSNQFSGRAKSYFEGNNEPKRPELKWFIHDDNIKGLIEMRCSDKNAIKSRVLELEGSVSSTMSQKTAFNIDVAIKKSGGKSAISMEQEAIRENSRKLIFSIDF